MTPGRSTNARPMEIAPGGFALWHQHRGAPSGSRPRAARTGHIRSLDTAQGRLDGNESSL